jgi:transcriptional pleiotropic regulator of transition state genes
MIKKIEEAGKFFIPSEYMQELRWYEGDSIEMFVRSGELVMRKLTPSCIFCNSAGKLVKLGRLCACRACIGRLHEANDGDYLYPV